MSVVERGNQVHISVDEETLLRSIALLESMNDFCKSRSEEGVDETVEALSCAIETMQAFWCEHFQDGEERRYE